MEKVTIDGGHGPEMIEIPDGHRESCQRELSGVWGRYGIWVLLQSLADVIDCDTDRLRKMGDSFVSEIEYKDTMSGLIRRAAGSSVQ